LHPGVKFFYAGSNAAVSALLVWLCVQKFAQTSSASAIAISSENLVAAQVEPAESEMMHPPADSSEQPILDDQNASDTKAKDGADGEQLIASDAGDS